MVSEENGTLENGKNAEMGHAKFINSGEVDVDINAKTKLIYGLTKEQLEKYRDDTFYRPLRCTLFIAFWLIWIGLFAGAVLLVVLSPKCVKKNDETDSRWFETTINYQIYTPSFYDSDGDGVGDLRGISLKLDRLRRIGVTSIRPTPILATMKDDFTPSHVQNVLAVDERFGSTDDARALVDAAHSNGIRVITDLPLTVDPYSLYAKSQKSESMEQAALLDIDNATNVERLAEAARNMLRWGVDSLQITDYGYAKKPGHTKSLDPLIEKIREIAKIDDAIREKNPVIIVEWTWRSSTTLADVYVHPLTTSNGTVNSGGSSASLLDYLTTSVNYAIEVYSLGLTKTKSDNEATKKRKAVPMWTYADLATPRLDQQIDLDPLLSTNTNDTMALLSLIQSFLPGPISIYYGEEYGLISTRPTATRFPQRGIMRWDGSASHHAGFTALGTTGEIFFGDIEGSTTNLVNIAFEQQLINPQSQLRMFKRIAELRNRNSVLKYGSFIHAVYGIHFYMRRARTGRSEIFVLAANWPVNGRTESRPIYRKTIQHLIGSNRTYTLAEVKAATPNIADPRVVDAATILNLAPFQAVLLRIM